MSSKNSPSEPFYISLDVVLEIHQPQLREFGGSDGVRNRSGLESAVESPKATFDAQDLYPTVFLKAAAYAFHIAEAQAFVDGNKRTALDVALTFLSINGCEINDERMELAKTPPTYGPIGVQRGASEAPVLFGRAGSRFFKGHSGGTQKTNRPVQFHRPVAKD